MINPDIFKKYDIRGKFPEDINPTVIRKFVKPYISVFSSGKIIIGHDPLEGSKEVYFPLCEEFSKNHVQVYRVGEISTPMLYFATAHYNVPQGIVLTASHLGIGHSGMKIVIDGIPPTPDQMKDMAEKVVKDEPLTSPEGIGPNLMVFDDVYSEYIKKIKEVLGDFTNPKKYKIAVDISNGPNGHVARKLFDDLGLDYVLINEEVKAFNLAHDTNPKIAKNREQLVETLLAHKADLGVIWDGDGDRAYFVDWNGDVIPPEFVGSLIGKNLISQGKGKKMTIDIRGSKAVEEEVSEVGGEVIRIEAWHVPIKYEMQKDSDVVFGMETSGHYVFRDLYKIDDGLMASMMFLKALSEDEIPLRQKLTKFRSKYKIIEEINFKASKSEEELNNELSELYKDGDINHIDGFTVDYPTWRFNLRHSRTEPIIRLNISGVDFEKVDANLEKIKEILGNDIIK